MISSSVALLPNSLHSRFVYEPGLGFIYICVRISGRQRLLLLTDLALATGHGDVDKTAGVSEPLLCAALRGLGLLLRFDLQSSESALVPGPER